MKAILFDLDNTILNTHPILQKYILRITGKLSSKEEHELETKDIHHLKEWARKEKIRFSIWKKIIYVTHFVFTDIKKIKPIKGMPELITKLNKKTDLAIITNGPKIYAKKVLRINKLLKYFITVQTTTNNKAKPSTEMIYKAAKKLNRNVIECIVVDDSESGINAGKKAGCITIYFSKNKNIKSNYYAQNVKELEKILIKII